MTLWARWKKPVKLAITLDPEDVEGAQDTGGNTGDNYIKMKMPFNSLMTEFFEGNTTYVCAYQEANRKSTNACEWFYARLSHAFAYKLS